MVRKCLCTKTKCFSGPTSLVQETKLTIDKVPLTILNIYVPLPDKGDTSTWIQAQNTIRELKLRKEYITPAEYAYQLIEERVKAACAKEQMVLMGGDFNCEHKEGSAMTERLGRLQLANVVAGRHRDTSEMYK